MAIKSIRQKLLWLLLFVNLTSAAAYTWFAYENLRSAVIESIDKRLLSAAYAAAKITTRAYHERIEGPESVSEADYMTMLKRLSEYAEQTGMVYVYTYMKRPADGMVVIASTNATDAELDTNTYSRFFKPYPEAPEQVLKAFETDEPQFATYTDSYGSFRSVFVRLQTDSGKVFVSGADFSIGFVQELLNGVVRDSALIGGTGFIIFFLIGYAMVDRIVQPLAALTGHTRDIVAANFQVQPKTLEALEKLPRGRRDEVGELAHAMAHMMSTLETYIVNLRETTTAKERVEGELNAARDIQMGILPRNFPAFPDRHEFDLHAIMEPAKQVGGDLYDFFMLDENRLVFLVGDVSGKGVPAALFMAVAKTLFKSNATRPDITIERAIERVNAELAQENPSALFITACAGIIDLRTGDIEYCDAGHDPPYIQRADGTIEKIKKVPGLALCVFEDFSYTMGRLKLEPGDALVLYTDGVTEALNLGNEEFTSTRIAEVLAGQSTGAGATALNEAILGAVKDFANGAEQSDDITLLAIRYHGPDGQGAQRAMETAAV
ncbi:MAG TPA: SpoIIE family protein phosphatase [Azospirillaceae bacterium]|nr:SpoIIE family protein phosphatase [Azospirillaceae bacterium]